MITRLGDLLYVSSVTTKDLANAISYKQRGATRLDRLDSFDLFRSGVHGFPENACKPSQPSPKTAELKREIELCKYPHYGYRGVLWVFCMPNPAGRR